MQNDLTKGKFDKTSVKCYLCGFKDVTVSNPKKTIALSYLAALPASNERGSMHKMANNTAKMDKLFGELRRKTPTACTESQNMRLH